MVHILKGKSEGMLYSLSRWTDLPISKWDWFKSCLHQGWMLGLDPRNTMMNPWSLLPEDVLGMVFWTKNPTYLIEDHKLLRDFPLVIHMTLTGWVEVEHGAPNLKWGLRRMKEAVDTFGPDRVVWRFSPIPLVPDVAERFDVIAREVEAMGLKQVYVSFLQGNDLIPETRSPASRLSLLTSMARSTRLQIKVCRENMDLSLTGGIPNLSYGVCEDGSRFRITTPLEKCGCALSVDPFSINEACSMSCEYCYSSDKTLSSERRNTTKLKVIS